MPQAAVSPFKQHVKTGPVIDPPLEILKHSSSPTKRSFSRPGAGIQLSPSKVRNRSPERHKKVPRVSSGPSRRLFTKELTPDIIWGYAQLVYNVIMVVIVVIAFGAVVQIFRNDVRNRVEKQSSAVLFEIEECTRNYIANKCMPNQRVPLTDELCAQWEKCMNMNPETVLHSQIFAEAVSDALSSFLGALSWESLLFIFAGALGVPMAVNCLGPRRR